MPDYKNGKIYKIISDGCDKVYIGSTACPRLSSRIVQHRCDYKRWLDGKCNFCTSFIIFFYDEPHNAKIILIESYPCNSSDELKAREEYWRNEIPNTVNQLKAHRTKKEILECENNTKKAWDKRNPNYKKDWYEKNKTRILKKNKEQRRAKKKAMKQE